MVMRIQSRPEDSPRIACDSEGREFEYDPGNSIMIFLLDIESADFSAKVHHFPGWSPEKVKKGNNYINIAWSYSL